MNYKFSGRIGYDTHDVLKCICEQLKPDSYLEIGVDSGGSCKVVVDNSNVKLLVLCDLWSPNYSLHYYKDHSHVEKLLKDYKGQVVYLDGNSLELIPNLALGQFDLILVDGGHDSYTAYKDMCNCWVHLRKGGVLVLDDIRHPSYPGVPEAFKKFSIEHRFTEIEGDVCNTIAIIK